MLDIRWIRETSDALMAALADRGWMPDAGFLAKLGEAWPAAVAEIAAAASPEDKRAKVIAALRQADYDRRELIGRVEAAQQEANAASRMIGKAKADGDELAAAQLMAEVSTRKVALQEHEQTRRKYEQSFNDALAYIPNIPAADVPVGADERANALYREWGKKRVLPDPKEHFQLGETLGMDFETAAKLSGARFVVLKGQLARLERALGQFMLDLHTTEHGYTEVAPPLLVRDEVLFGTGQLPKFAEDQFTAVRLLDRQTKTNLFKDLLDEAPIDSPIRRDLNDLVAGYDVADAYDRLWLIPTAEVPLTNLVRESILSEDELPRRVTALTPCFRSEAGSAGKDTRGMLRQHQFDKVELVSITTPEQSVEEHERMLVCAEEVMKRLDLHYRVMTLATGDMGFSAAKTWDIEVWLPGQGTYREISSCSLCGDFQARRMQARYRPKEAKGTRLLHTLNGSGVAVGRALIAVMETYQNPDGSLTVPDVLRPYMGGVDKIG